MSATFFTITVPAGEDPRAWAKRMWDTYGFDYDMERIGEQTICAWPMYHNEDLIETLEQDDIRYETFEVEDVDRFFGL